MVEAWSGCGRGIARRRQVPCRCFAWCHRLLCRAAFKLANDQGVADGFEFNGIRIVKDGVVSAAVIPAGNGKVVLLDAGYDKAGNAILAELSRRQLTPWNMALRPLCINEFSSITRSEPAIDRRDWDVRIPLGRIRTNASALFQRLPPPGKLIEHCACHFLVALGFLSWPVSLKSSQAPAKTHGIANGNRVQLGKDLSQLLYRAESTRVSSVGNKGHGPAAPFLRIPIDC